MLAASDLICARCGNLRSLCSDPAIDWHPQESVCWVTATQEWGWRRLHNKHKDFKTDTLDDRGEPPMSPLDGLSVWVTDVDLEALAHSDDKDESRDEG